MALAIFCIYAVDFAINAGIEYLPKTIEAWSHSSKVQATARSLIVDTLPESQQQLGSAWGAYPFKLDCHIRPLISTAGRMLGLGHVLGYFIGTVDLMKYFGTWLGGSQFKQICMIASTTIISCTAITCYCVEERVLISKR